MPRAVVDILFQDLRNGDWFGKFKIDLKNDRKITPLPRIFDRVQNDHTSYITQISSYHLGVNKYTYILGVRYL